MCIHFYLPISVSTSALYSYVHTSPSTRTTTIDIYICINTYITWLQCLRVLIPVRACNTGELRATRYGNDSVLQCVAVCCSVLQYVAVCRSMLQCVAVCCSLSHMIRLSHLPAQPTQRKTVQNSVHVAVCCSVLHRVALCCSVLQCVAVCCSVLQCVAVCCIR